MNVEKFVGEVIWFDAKLGFGFLTREGERDLFVHWSDISDEGFKTLKKGQKVAYSVGVNNKGQPKAIEVVVLEETSDQKTKS